MNLKEAFRYHNVLDGWYRQAEGFFGMRSFMSNQSTILLNVKEKHLRSAANPEGKDEELVIKPAEDIPYDADQLVDLMISLIDTKKALCSAIMTAKSGCGYDIDGIILTNKLMQQAGKTFMNVASVKTTKQTTPTGKGFMLNAEKNQVPYVYDIERTTDIKFNRDKVRGAAKSLIAKAEKNSTQLDELMVGTQVGYMPTYDVNDSFEDVYAAFDKAHPKTK